MKKIVALLLFFVSGIAYSQSCTTSSYELNGRTYYCITCCYNGHCNTSCS